MAVSRTTNGGITWQRYNLTAGTGFCYALAIDPANRSIIYAGGIGGLFKSTNSGSTWNSSSTGLTGDVYGLAVNPGSTNIIYAGSTAGVFKSTDAGSSWSNTGCTNVRVVAVYPGAPDTLFAATSSGIYRSNTGGGNWTAMNTGLASTNTASLGFNPGRWLFCGTRGAGMYRADLTTSVEEEVNTAGIPAFSIMPNPCRGRTMITLNNADQPIRGSGRRTPGHQQPGLSIYDVAGRVVRSFDLATRYSRLAPPVVWDCTDDQGTPLPAGVYFVRLSNASGSATKSVVLTR